MGIYTKTGDHGLTSLFDGQRVAKNSKRVAAYGTIDECNAQISLGEKLLRKRENAPYLVEIQRQLFVLSAEIATTDIAQLKQKSHLIDRGDIVYLEGLIDKYTAVLPKIKEFILPGKSLSGAQLHVARAVSRRAERQLVSLAEVETLRPEVLKYLNRLSDCLYILARSEDQETFQQELLKRVVDTYLKRVDGEVKNTSSLDLPLILKLQAAITAKAKQLAVPVTFAVADESGIPIYRYRMPGALLASVELAEKKAYTAVAMKMPSDELKELVTVTGELSQLDTTLEGKIVTFGGGLPLYEGQRVIAGIGVSGGSVSQDVELAEIANKCYQKEVLACRTNN